MPSTAIGSVGEMSAPHSRQAGSGSSSCSQGCIHQIATPTTAVDRAVPANVNSATGRRKSRRYPTSIPRAPANSSSDSMLFIKRPGKSNTRSSEAS